MFFVFFAHRRLKPDHAIFGLMMRIGMGSRPATGVNIVLIGDGVKHAMLRRVLSAAAARQRVGPRGRPSEPSRWSDAGAPSGDARVGTGPCRP